MFSVTARMFIPMLAAAAVLVGGMAPVPAGDDGAERLRRDLEKLKGRWERAIPGSQPPQKEILTIDGDKETFSIEESEGRVIRKLTARIRLESEGSVVIYTRSDIKLIDGDQPPDPLPKTQSFIYKFYRGELHELSGLLYDRTGSRKHVAHNVWTQPGVERKSDPAAPATPSPAEVPDDPETKRDLKLLQGRWERISRDAGGKVTFEQQKVVEGNEETLTNRNAEGKVVHKHAVKFRLEKHGPVRIYNFYEMTVYRDDGTSQTFPADYSFVYRLDEKEFLDAPGLFESRATYLPNPALHTWVRPEKTDENPEGKP